MTTFVYLKDVVLKQPEHPKKQDNPKVPFETDKFGWIDCERFADDKLMRDYDENCHQIKEEYLNGHKIQERLGLLF